MLIRFRDGGVPSPFNLFDDFFGRDLSSFFGRDMSEFFSRNPSAIMPAVNIRETENSFQIELAAPGLRKENFQVNVDHNVLTISAQQESRMEEAPMSQNPPQVQNTTNGSIAGQASGGSEGTTGQSTAGEPTSTAQESVGAQAQTAPAMQSSNQGQMQRYTRREFSYTSFQRSFSLPENVETDKIAASYQDGILTVTVPKREQPARLSRNVNIS